MNRRGKRRQREMRLWLLGTASVGSLLGFASSGAHADDWGLPIDHIYLNFDAQWSSESGGPTVWGDPFGNEQLIRLRNNGVDYFGGLTAQSGDWFFSLQANYGRTGNSHAVFDESRQYSKYTARDLGEASSFNSHINLDFTVGRDVGLGMFGLEGTSIISAGVQYAHFISSTVSTFQYYHKYGVENAFARQLDRQFWGIGPIISWQASTPIVPESHISLDWGVNAALLMGRRSFEVDGEVVRHNSVALPQVGGYLGFGFQFPGTPFNLTAGYSVMATFDALDSGYSSAGPHNTQVSFGPYVGTYIQIQ